MLATCVRARAYRSPGAMRVRRLRAVFSLSVVLTSPPVFTPLLDSLRHLPRSRPCRLSFKSHAMLFLGGSRRLHAAARNGRATCRLGWHHKTVSALSGNKRPKLTMRKRTVVSWTSKLRRIVGPNHPRSLHTLSLESAHRACVLHPSACLGLRTHRPIRPTTRPP